MDQQPGADLVDRTAAGQVGRAGRRSMPSAATPMVRPATRDLISAPVPSATTRPSASTTIRSATCVGLVEVVGGEQHGPAGAGEVLHRPPERCAGSPRPSRRSARPGSAARDRASSPARSAAAGPDRRRACRSWSCRKLPRSARSTISARLSGWACSPCISRSTSITGGVVQQRPGLQHGADPALANGRVRVACRTPGTRRRRAGPCRGSSRWWWTCRRRSGPSMATISPGARVRSTPRTACTSRYDLVSATQFDGRLPVARGWAGGRADRVRQVGHRHASSVHRARRDRDSRCHDAGVTSVTDGPG